jgi:pSer/pThr/pTyr-binding forkhead associated (FHA) protein
MASMPRLLSVPNGGFGEEEHPIRRTRTTIGRRSFNDIVLNHRSVSGEHALLTLQGEALYVEDLNSTNGTFVNGQLIKRHLLRHNDAIEIGGCVLRFVADDGLPSGQDRAPRPPPARGRPDAVSSGQVSGAGQFQTLPAGLGGQHAMVRVLTGESAGRELMLTKVVTTIGKPGVQLASISRRPSGFVLAHVEGSGRPSVNLVAMLNDVMPISDGDVIDLAGTRMRFFSG